MGDRERKGGSVSEKVRERGRMGGERQMEKG